MAEGGGGCSKVVERICSDKRRKQNGNQDQACMTSTVPNSKHAAVSGGVWIVVLRQ